MRLRAHLSDPRLHSEHAEDLNRWEVVTCSHRVAGLECRPQRVVVLALLFLGDVLPQQGAGAAVDYEGGSSSRLDFAWLSAGIAGRQAEREGEWDEAEERSSACAGSGLHGSCLS